MRERLSANVQRRAVGSGSVYRLCRVKNFLLEQTKTTELQDIGY